MSLIIIFIDGVGIGENDPTINPCLHSNYKLFSDSQNLSFDGKKFALDACLNVKGFPQSATGQCTIYTGINCAKILGKHLFGFPNEKLRVVLKQDSFFVTLTSKGFQLQFINAFRPIFFTTPEIFKDLRMSTTVNMNRSANLKFNSLRDIKKKKALYHDFSNLEIIEKGFKVPEYSALDASKILISQAEQHDLILYEYFLTDMAGHSKNMERSINELNKIESLIMNVIQNLDLSEHSLVLCSDHGNIEDIRKKSHTTNPAFFAVWTNSKYLEPKSLIDIKPLIELLIKQKSRFPNNTEIGR